MERPSKTGRASGLFSSGIADFNQGRHEQALGNLKQAAELEPDNATYCCFYGQALYYTGELEQARQYLTRAVQLDQGYVPAWKSLGLVCRDMDDRNMACEALAYAITANPSDATSAQLFMENFSALHLTGFSDWVKDAIILCLKTEQADHQVIGRAWGELFMLDPAFLEMRNAEPGSRAPAGLNDQYLTLGLQRFHACSMPFERVMMNLRHLLLNKAQNDLSAYQTFLCSLATQMWLNEYIYLTSADEEKSVTALKNIPEQKIEDTPAYIAKLCLYACYAPLLTLGNAKEILQTLGAAGSAPFRKLLQLQIAEPLEEQEIKKNIKCGGTITDDISQAVRAQYEQYPYPRWRFANRTIKTNPDAIDVLIAGCGTGMQTALCAALHPDARIHSVDLSLNSLAYAIRQTNALGFKNLTFEQADILDFDPGDKKYDMIECVGVLHHMEDPDAGLKSLLKHLKPGGKMWLGLYSAFARHDIAVVRKMIADGKIKSQDLQNLRHEIADHPDPLVNYFIYKSDFYTMSSCCDLIWHAQEYHYTLPEIEKLLKDNGLEFGEFFFTNKNILKAFRKKYPREGDEKDLKKWHEYEQKNPALFAGMYTFTVRRA